VLRKHQHRVAVRRAEVAHQKARQRLALAWRSLTTPCAPHARGAACGEAVTQSASAAPLLRSSGRPQEAQRLEEAKDDLARSWSKLAEQSLKEAAYMCDLQQMRSAVKECGVLRNCLGTGEFEKEWLSDKELEQTLLEIIAEESGSKLAMRQKFELSLNFVLATVTLETDQWAFNAKKWMVLLHQVSTVLRSEEQRFNLAQRLEAALQRQSALKELRAILEAAQEVPGLHPSALERVQRQIEVCEGRVRARWGLVGAMMSARVSSMLACVQGSTWVRTAIKEAKSAGLEKRDLEVALDFFDRMEHTRALHVDLTEAVSTRNFVQLRSIIKQMDIAYVGEPTDHVSRCRTNLAKAKLDFLLEQDAAARGLLSILDARRKTLYLTELPKEIENAKRLHVDAGDITRAEEALEVAQAHDLLQGAVECGDVQAVKAAIQNARRCEHFKDWHLQDQEKHMEQAELFRRISEALAANHFQEAKQLLQKWKARDFDKDAIKQLEAAVQRADSEILKDAQAILDGLKPLTFNGKELTPDSFQQLHSLAASLRDCDVILQLESFSGHKAFTIAQDLANGRAEAVKSTLRKFGCKHRILTKAWANADPGMQRSVLRISALEKPNGETGK
ncbi:unnamed protein product, partial [Effrenium voratum]